VFDTVKQPFAELWHGADNRTAESSETSPEDVTSYPKALYLNGGRLVREAVRGEGK